MTLTHVGISVTDIERSIAFYCDTLEMKQQCDVFPFGGEAFESIMDIPGVTGRMCMIGNDALNLELFEFTKSKEKDPAYPVSDRGISHFGIEVPDIAATAARLRAVGARFHCPVRVMSDNGLQATYVRDPDGNVFELLEAGPKG